MEINFDEYLVRTGQTRLQLEAKFIASQADLNSFQDALFNDGAGWETSVFGDVLKELERQVELTGVAKIGEYTINFESFGQQANFKADDFTIDSFEDVAFLHFVRNIAQDANITYYEVIKNADDYIKLSDVENTFHKDNNFFPDNENNVKWVSKDGKEEYIFRETSDGWELVTDPFNQGSYNYIPQSESGSGHLNLDVWTWELFGNFITDPSDQSDRAVLTAQVSDLILNGTLEPVYEFQTIRVDPDALGVLAVDNPSSSPEIKYEFFGDDRDNYIFSGPNADTVFGREGIDTLSYELSTSGVTVNLELNSAYDGFGARENAGSFNRFFDYPFDDKYEVIVGVENVVGSNFSDIIIGDGNANTLTGLAGNDILDGGAGLDTAVFSGNRSDYGFSSEISGGIGVSNFASGETDILFEIERIQFADMITDQFGNEITDGSTFPENGVSETISLADAVGEFGVADGSEVSRLFLESLDLTVENVNFLGSESAAFLVGDFEIQGTTVDYQGGILLSSGGFPGPSNTESGFTVVHGTSGDSDLDVVAQQAFPGAGQTQDASILEFRLFVEDPSLFSFDIVFGSDEYPEFANSSFVDVAAVFVNGENVALFPGSDAPLSITNDNVLGNLVDNRNGGFATEWDGFAALALTAILDAGWNEIKIGVADTGDDALDTAIYLTDFELASRAPGDDDSSGRVLLKNVGGPLDNSLFASNTPQEHTFYEPSSPSEPNVPGSLSGTASSFNNDVVTNFKSDDEIRINQLQQIELLKQAVDLLQQLINIKKGSAIIEIDEDLDGSVDSVLTLEGDFENSRFKAEIIEDDVVLTLEELNTIFGSEKVDTLEGTDGADAIRSLGGVFDLIRGGDGGDQFIFGSETNNGDKERDLILDYEVGIDAILLEDGASVDSIREVGQQVFIHFEGDGDTLILRGDGVTAENLTIITEDVFQLV